MGSCYGHWNTKFRRAGGRVTNKAVFPTTELNLVRNVLAWNGGIISKTNMTRQPDGPDVNLKHCTTTGPLKAVRKVEYENQGFWTYCSYTAGGSG